MGGSGMTQFFFRVGNSKTVVLTDDPRAYHADPEDAIDQRRLSRGN